MAKVTIKLNRQGVGELLNSKWAADCCTEVAQKVAARAGEEYAPSEPRHTGQRIAVDIKPTTIHAARSNAKHNTLLRALG